MEMLSEVGLVVTQHYSKEQIRTIQRNLYQEKPQNQVLDANEPLPYDTTTAEQSYADAISGMQAISTAMFELTYNCSEKCIHCYNVGATRNDNEISGRSCSEMVLDDYKRIIDELCELGLYKVCLTGGDPFSKPIVWEIIDYLYNKDIAFDIYTNGQSITNQIERLRDYYPRLVGLSIYSAIDEIHDKITRVNGSLQKTLRVAKQLADYCIPMSFKCVIFKANVKSYYSVVDLAEQYEAIVQFEVNLSNGVDGDVSIVNNLGLPAEILEIILRDNRIPQYVGPEMIDYGGVKKPLSAHPCRAGIGNFNLTPDGNITPCCAFPMILGNTKDSSISEIIVTSKVLEQWHNTKIEDIEFCGREEKCAFCMLCAGNGFIEHTTPLKSSAINCYMAEVRYNLARKLQIGYDPLNGLTIPERLNQTTIEEVTLFYRETPKK